MKNYKVIYKNKKTGINGTYDNVFAFVINKLGEFIDLYFKGDNNARTLLTLCIPYHEEIEIYLDDTRIYYFKDGKEINV